MITIHLHLQFLSFKKQKHKQSYPSLNIHQDLIFDDAEILLFCEPILQQTVHIRVTAPQDALYQIGGSVGEDLRQNPSQSLR